jgi:hypothetical protein
MVKFEKQVKLELRRFSKVAFVSIVHRGSQHFLCGRVKESPLDGFKNDL